jgi:hypothetical protein
MIGRMTGCGAKDLFRHCVYEVRVGAFQEHNAN